MISPFRLHQELVAKQKLPDYQVGGLPLLRRRFYSVSLLTAHRRESFIPALGTVALHCPVARLNSESFLMSVERYRDRVRAQFDLRLVINVKAFSTASSKL